MIGRRRGVSLIEVLIAATISVLLIATAVSALRGQERVTAEVSNADTTFFAATRALHEIRKELKSVVQNPQGLTNATSPAYGFGTTTFAGPTPIGTLATRFTWRPLIGYIDPTDANYATYSAQGRVSSNNMLYENYSKTIYWDWNGTTGTKALKIKTETGGPGSVILLSDRVIAGWDPALLGGRPSGQTVEEFAFTNGESTSTPAAAADSTAWSVGFYIRIDRTSCAPEDRGKKISSNVTGAATSRLSGEVLMQPETVLSSKGKPFVGP